MISSEARRMFKQKDQTSKSKQTNKISHDACRTVSYEAELITTISTYLLSVM